MNALDKALTICDAITSSRPSYIVKNALDGKTHGPFDSWHRTNEFYERLLSDNRAKIRRGEFSARVFTIEQVPPK